MAQGSNRPPAAARIHSLPPTARTSAEHVRALDAAGPLSLHLFKKLAQRPLMSLWQGEDDAGTKVVLTVLDACGTPAERARVMGAAHELHAVIGMPGVRRITRVRDESDAFVADFLGAGTAADLLVLRWPLVRRLEFVCRVCEALVALHGAGIVHGCLCPDNILLDDDLRPVLSEVGMVSIADSLDGDPESFFGYGAFASDAAKRGAPDVQSDLYSVGRLLSFVILDRPPSDEPGFAEVEAKCPEVTPILRRCESASQPYASAAELLADLNRVRQRLQPSEGQVTRRAPEPRAAPVAAAAPNKAPPGVWAPDAPARKRRAPFWVALVSGLGLVILCGIAHTLLSSGPLRFVLQAAVAAAAMGLTASVPLTTLARVPVSLAALLVALLVNPIALVSRLDASDGLTRGGAARDLVLHGEKDLHNRRFQRADFSGLDMRDTNLDGADLSRANFTGTKLTNARVTGTSFILANMSGADLTGVELDKAHGAETAQCDTATVTPKDWKCSAEGKLSR